MLQEFTKRGRDSRVREGPVGQGVTLCLVCDDARAVYQSISGRGIEASAPIARDDVCVTTVLDPDGYRLEFESPAR